MPDDPTSCPVHVCLSMCCRSWQERLKQSEKHKLEESLSLEVAIHFYLLILHLFLILITWHTSWIGISEIDVTNIMSTTRKGI